MTKSLLNKKFAFLFLLVLQAGILFAQKPSSAECKQKLNDFKELAQKGERGEIYIAWLSLKKNCASLEEEVFVEGEKFLNERILQADTSEEKAVIIQELLSLYDEHDKVFPNNKRGNRIQKAIVLYENKQGTPAEIYSLLDQSFTAEGSSFVNASLLNTYSKLIADQLKDGKITHDQALEKLDKIYEKIQVETVKLQAEKNKYAQQKDGNVLAASDLVIVKNIDNSLQEMKLVSKNSNGIVNAFSTCESLTAFYQKDFEKQSKNGLWLERASERLEEKKCKSDFYLKVLEKWNEVSPNAKSAYSLALLARQGKDKDKSKAIAYFVQSASFETDAVKRSNIYYLVATTYAGSDKEKATSFAKKAIESNPGSGKSYILLAQFYSNSANECATSDFDKKAIYWLASSTAKQAGIVEPSLKKSADELAARFAKQAPSKPEIKAADKKAGDKVSFRCWINETISIPKL